MVRNLTIKTPIIVLLILAFLELLLISKFRNVFGIHLTPILYTLITLSIGFLILFKSKITTIYEENNIVSIIKCLITTNILLLILWYCYRCFTYYPIDQTNSDVFPQIIAASKNFLSLKWPYEVIKMDGYEIMVNYLPSFWLPFIISHITNTDVRWIPILFWVVSIVYFIIALRKHSGIESNISGINFLKINKIYLFTISFSVLIYGFYLYVKSNTQEYAYTLEFLPAAYYIFLIGSLLRKKPIEISLSITLILTSRFSILFFIPVILYFVYLNQGKTDFKRVVIYLFSFLILILGYFLVKDPQLIQKILNNYNIGTRGEWKVYEWQQPGEKPYQLSRGIGFAIYFYEYFINNKEKGISLFKYISIGLSLILSSISIYLLKKNIVNNQYLLLLGCLKIYLAIFYSFSLVPYTYLMVVPCSISLILVLYYLQISNTNKSTVT